MSDSSKQMLINVEEDETRIAIVNNQMLDNLYIDYTHRAQTVGNIYSGVVVKVQSSFQAAFVDYGADRHGFLAASDLNQMLFKAPRGVRGRPAINQLLRPGQSIMIQVVKDEIAHKGAALTTNISLPGRFLVFMPHSDKGGVSKRIEDNETRTRLKHLLKGLGSEDASAIIRTAGVDRSLTELKQDFMTLRRTWNQIRQNFESTNKPCLLHREEDAVVRMLRDYYTDDIDDVIIDDPEAFQRALEFFQTNMPGKQKRLQLYLGERPLFSEHRIEDQIEWLNHPQVPLPSGGSLVIQPTEALVSIDVNSGKSNQEKNIEETALRSNMEAAEEVARQLRLRNLGGLIVIDFIDMNSSQNRQAVVQCLADSLANDKAKWTLGEISQFGLLEMSRQRIASSLSQSGKEVCPSCHGTGKVSSYQSLANKILRQMRDLVLNGRIQEVRLRLPLELADQILNQKRKQLHQLELEYSLRARITPDPSLSPNEVPEIELVGRDGNLQHESLDSDPREAYRNRDFRARARRDYRVRREEPAAVEDADLDDTLLEEIPTPMEEATESLDTVEELAEEASENDFRQRKSRSRSRGRGRGRGRGRREFYDENHSDEDAETLDSSEESEPESEETEVVTETTPVQPLAAPPVKRSAGRTIYNSIHELSGEEDDTPWQPKQLSPWRRKLRMLPPNTLVFSSTHIDAQGNLLNQPSAKHALGNASSVEAPEQVSLDLALTESSLDVNEEVAPSVTTTLSVGSMPDMATDTASTDITSVQTDSDENAISALSNETRADSPSDKSSNSVESTPSEAPDLTLEPQEASPLPEAKLEIHESLPMPDTGEAPAATDSAEPAEPFAPATEEAEVSESFHATVEDRLQEETEEADKPSSGRTATRRTPRKSPVTRTRSNSRRSRSSRSEEVNAAAEDPSEASETPKEDPKEPTAVEEDSNPDLPLTASKAG